MLKKLAKYGNSTALVIDKAILELLNINESSIVKLRTDGNSLIITPAESTENTKISYDGFEALEIARQTTMDKTPKIKNMPLNDPRLQKLGEAFKDIFKNHKNIFFNFHNQICNKPEFVEAVKNINANPETDTKVFQEEVNKIIAKHYPEYENLLKNIKDITSKHMSN